MPARALRPAGLLVIDKPSGLTSHDVVERIRRILRCRVGHAGTLDPQATGVLLVCLGAATRLARFLQGHDKAYEGTVRLGWATDTYDAEGEALADPVTPPRLRREQVQEVLDSFVGAIEQTPPAYSAKKVRGQPAYRRARRGEDVRPKPVTVEIHSAELLDLTADTIQVRIHCGAGTYVRTLARELGEALGCPAHLAGLRRTRSGSFSLRHAVSWKAIEETTPQALEERILPATDMVPDWPIAMVGEEGADATATGRILEASWIVERRPGISVDTPGGAKDSDGWVRVVDRSGAMIAAGEMVPGGLIQPRIVLR
jgi:tRNA pseudouridine55 synthase